MPLVAFLLLCFTNGKVLAKGNLRDTTVIPPFATSSYNDSFYNSVLSAAAGIAQPFLLQQGYLTMPGVTVVDTSLIFNGKKYLTSNVYYTPRTTSRIGFYISSTDYPYYGVANFSSIWSKECPNIFYDTIQKLFHTSTDCIGFGIRVISAVGGTSSANNAYLKFANAILKAKICHLAAVGHAPDSYEMATSFATLPSTPINGWEYISGNGLFTDINTYNHTLDNTLGTYTGVRKGGFGLAKAGDILCFGDGPLSTNNGHTMIFADAPIKLSASGLKTFFTTLSSSKINSFIAKHTTYQVNVYDDCDNLHYNDSRTKSGITGIGYGTILIVTDTLDDAPIGYFFTPSTSLTYTALDTAKTYAICVARYTTASQLPVVIDAFSAEAINELVQLKWQTASESNTSKFIVQRSADAKNFADINTVSAIGNSANSYRFVDPHPLNGINYYRLMIVDNIGSSTYSKTVDANLSIKNIHFLIYPNPAKNIVTINGNHISSVQLIDNACKQLMNKSFLDATNPSINISRLHSGVYYLRIQITDGSTRKIGFVKE